MTKHAQERMCLSELKNKIEMFEQTAGGFFEEDHEELAEEIIKSAKRLADIFKEE